MRRFTGAGEFFYWTPTLSSVVSDADIVKENRGENFDRIREQFSDLLLKCCPIGVYDDLDHSAPVRCAPLGFVL